MDKKDLHSLFDKSLLGFNVYTQRRIGDEIFVSKKENSKTFIEEIVGLSTWLTSFTMIVLFLLNIN